MSRRRVHHKVLELAALASAAIALGGCRSCSHEEAPDLHPTAVSGPTMPTGMLVPTDGPSGAADAGSSLQLARGLKSGAWVEVQVAPPGDRAARKDFQRWRDDSAFVSLEAMSLMHEPFAHALPGFDLFLPRLYAGESLAALARELDAFAARAQGELGTTASQLAAMARAALARGAGLWILAS